MDWQNNLQTQQFWGGHRLLRQQVCWEKVRDPSQHSSFPVQSGSPVQIAIYKKEGKKKVLMPNLGIYHLELGKHRERDRKVSLVIQVLVPRRRFMFCQVTNPLTLD